MLHRERIIEELKNCRVELEKLGVDRIGLFGSYSTRTADQDSDIDILVKFIPGSLSFNNYMDLKIFLENAFSRKIDLVIEDDIRPELKEEILSTVVYAA